MIRALVANRGDTLKRWPLRQVEYRGHLLTEYNVPNLPTRPLTYARWEISQVQEGGKQFMHFAVSERHAQAKVDWLLDHAR